MRNGSNLAVLICLLTVSCLVGCSPRNGPVTARESQALTNAVQKLTSVPIVAIEQMDVNLMAVFTGTPASGKKSTYLAHRTRSGWKVSPVVTNP
jgi:hypothetical protein